jgi:hypothetical protein
MQHPCVQCGGTTFTWGSLGIQNFIHQSEVGKIILDASKIRRVHARLCETCGNVQIYARPRLKLKEKNG